MAVVQRAHTHTQMTQCFLTFFLTWVYDEADIVVAASLVFGGGVSAADTVDHTRHGSARVCAVAT